MEQPSIPDSDDSMIIELDEDEEITIRHKNKFLVITADMMNK